MNEKLWNWNKILKVLICIFFFVNELSILELYVFICRILGDRDSTISYINIIRTSSFFQNVKNKDLDMKYSRFFRDEENHYNSQIKENKVTE